MKVNNNWSDNMKNSLDDKCVNKDIELIRRAENTILLAMFVFLVIIFLVCSAGSFISAKTHSDIGIGIVLGIIDVYFFIVAYILYRGR